MFPYIENHCERVSRSTVVLCLVSCRRSKWHPFFWGCYVQMTCCRFDPGEVDSALLVSQNVDSEA
jgi:hypothetical protein